MKMLSFDIESCTGSHNDASLCSFGYVTADEFLNIKEQEDLLCNPKPAHFRLRPYSKKRQTEGITLAYSEKVFRRRPKFPGIYPIVKGLFDEADVAVGFSIENDVQFLNNACVEYGLPPVSYKFLDVRQIVELLYGTKYGCGLKTIAENLEIAGDSHRSDEDARVTLEILRFVLKDQSMTLSEFVSAYGIKFGQVNAEGYSNMVSEKGLKAQLDEGRLTRKQKNGIFEEYVKRVCRNLVPVSEKMKGQRISFSDKFVRDSLDEARSFVKAVYLSGGKFDLSGERANLYVRVSSYDDSEKIQKLKTDYPKMKFCTYGEAKKEVGPFETEDFSSFDLKALVRVASRPNRLK